MTGNTATEFSVYSRESSSKHRPEDGMTILHFNDVYNVDSTIKEEPIGGATRFLSAMKSFEKFNPLVLFSGDAFSPSMWSFFTHGEEMVPVLNSMGTKCAVLGNHDFDHGLEILDKYVKKSSFPWLMSNVVDKETGSPLGGGLITHIVNHGNKKIGLIGLVEKEWLDTLGTIDQNELNYIDFTKVGNLMGNELRRKGCDLVIALTHMRTANDIRLAENCPSIDVILGGHDHVYEVQTVNSIKIIKSGWDFKLFSKITVDFKRDAKNKVKVDVEQVKVTALFKEDSILKEKLSHYSSKIETSLDEVLGHFSVNLDGSFSNIRSSETNLGNWFCDVFMAATSADVALINSGTFRSDRIHPAGPFLKRDLITVIPMRDSLLVLEMTGEEILAALENGVSGYPELEGRFVQVAGISFAFDPKKKPQNRVDPRLVRIGDEWIDLKQKYKVCVKGYMQRGCDGFTMLSKCPILMDDETTPEIGNAVRNHFKSIEVKMGRAKHSKHRQSLVMLSRRHSTMQKLKTIPYEDYLNCPKQIKLRSSIAEEEEKSCQLAPVREHRITRIENDEHLQQLLSRRRLEEDMKVITEVQES